MYTIDKTTYTTRNYWTQAQLRGERTDSNIAVLVIHTTMGHMAGDIPELTVDRGVNSKSIHYYVAQSGRIYELVNPRHAAWHCYTKPANKRPGPFRRFLGDSGNENLRTIGIEFEARQNEPLTYSQKAAGAWLVAEICKQFPGIVPDRQHIIGHYEMSTEKIDPQRGIPGQGWSWDEFMRSVQAFLNPTPPTGRNRYFPETQKILSEGFLDLWRFEIDGYPITDEEVEIQPDGSSLTVQYFENSRMEWRPGAAPRRGAVGRMYLALLERLEE